LISAIGISPLTQVKVADVSDRKLSPEMEVSAEKVISTALARRPDILAAYAAQKASLAGVRAAEAEFLPKVFLSGTGSYNGGTLSVAGIPCKVGRPSRRSSAKYFPCRSACGPEAVGFQLGGEDLDAVSFEHGKVIGLLLKSTYFSLSRRTDERAGSSCPRQRSLEADRALQIRVAG
jgi:hypothetical protein